jgi:hypothetical protein
MSYDLYLKPRAGTLGLEQFLDYFRGKRNYELKGKQAWYENQDTGVYFSFAYSGATPENEYPVSFNINFFRPTFFVNESEIELTKFVTHFYLVASDPQFLGMGTGDYDRAAYIRGWVMGNSDAYKVMVNQSDAQPWQSHLPKDTLMAAWKWNHERYRYQDTLNTVLMEDRFSPKISFAMVDGTPSTLSVWPEGLAIAACQVDYVAVMDASAANTVPWKALETILASAGKPKDGSPQIFYSVDPANVKAVLNALPRNPIQIQLVASDKMLDRRQPPRKNPYRNRSMTPPRPASPRFSSGCLVDFT